MKSSKQPSHAQEINISFLPGSSSTHSGMPPLRWKLVGPHPPRRNEPYMENIYPPRAQLRQQAGMNGRAVKERAAVPFGGRIPYCGGRDSSIPPAFVPRPRAHKCLGALGTMRDGTAMRISEPRRFGGDRKGRVSLPRMRARQAQRNTPVCASTRIRHGGHRRGKMTRPFRAKCASLTHQHALSIVNGGQLIVLITQKHWRPPRCAVTPRICR